ncbi:MAG: hypothetical protein AAGA23_03890 [Pseudomonadota bacterium]
MGKDGFARLAVASALLMATVPWWARGLPTMAGLPGWVVAALGLSLGYAAVVAWLLQVFWDDTDEASATLAKAERKPPS